MWITDDETTMPHLALAHELKTLQLPPSPPLHLMAIPTLGCHGDPILAAPMRVYDMRPCLGLSVPHISHRSNPAARAATCGGTSYP